MYLRKLLYSFTTLSVQLSSSLSFINSTSFFLYSLLDVQMCFSSSVMSKSPALGKASLPHCLPLLIFLVFSVPSRQLSIFPPSPPSKMSILLYFRHVLMQPPPLPRLLILPGTYTTFPSLLHTLRRLLLFLLLPYIQHSLVPQHPRSRLHSFRLYSPPYTFLPPPLPLTTSAHSYVTGLSNTPIASSRRLRHPATHPFHRNPKLSSAPASCEDSFPENRSNTPPTAFLFYCKCGISISFLLSLADSLLLPCIPPPCLLSLPSSPNLCHYSLI